MTSEVPTHPGAGPAEPSEEYGVPSSWPGPHAEELDPTRVTQPPAGTAPAGAPPAMPGVFGGAPVPLQLSPQSPQEFPAYQAGNAAAPPQPVSPPAAPPPQLPAQQVPPQQVPPQPVSPPAAPPPQVPAQQVPPQPAGPQPVPLQGVPGQGAPAGAGPVAAANGAAPDGRATGRAQVPESALLPAHQLPTLPPPVPRVYGRAATDVAPQPAPAQHPQAQHPTVHHPPSQHPVAVHPAQAPVEPTPVSPPPVSPPPAYPHPAAPHIADPQAANSPGSPYAPAAAPNPPSSAFPPFAPPQPVAHSAPPAGGFAPAPPFGQPLGAPSYPPTEPPRPDPAAPAGFPAQPAPVTPPQTPDGYRRPPEQSRSQTVMLISVGLVVLLAVVGLIAFTWPRDRSEPAPFPVGTCVKESPEGRPVKAGCGDAGAYRVVSAESSKEQCPDQTQPHIDLGSGDKRILCLTPANEAATGSD